MLRFFDTVGNAMIRHLDFSIVKCVLVASPGFVKVGLFNSFVVFHFLSQSFLLQIEFYCDTIKCKKQLDIVKYSKQLVFLRSGQANGVRAINRKIRI